MAKKLLTVIQYARKKGMYPCNVYRWIQEGKIQPETMLVETIGIPEDAEPVYKRKKPRKYINK
jgi:predicted site-specific integrase-resolvase